MAEFQKKFVVVNSKGIRQELSIYTSPEEAIPYGKTFVIECEGMSGYIGLTNDFSLENVSDMYVIIDNIEYRALIIKPEKVFVLTLKAYRNNETFIQNLPNFLIYGENKTFNLNNENAPTIEGYDFVCCENNNTVIDENKEIKVYYIPNSISDRTKNNWSWSFLNATGDLSLNDFANTFNATTLFAAFKNSSIEKCPKLNTSNVTSFAHLFGNTSNSKEIDFSMYDASNVNDIQTMLSSCSASIIKLPLFTNKITSLYQTFYETQCNEINYNAINAENVTNMSYAFSSNKLSSIDLSMWKTPKLENMASIFAYARSIETINLDGWDTSNVTNMSLAFINCNLLQRIIGSLDLTHCTNVSNMFAGCTKLKNVWLKNVPRTLDLSTIGGVEGITYVIENFLGEEVLTNTVILKAYRNNDEYMQDLPSFKIAKGEKFYLNNENAPTIEGFDFVCCTNNNSVVNEDIEVKVYYIPKNVPDRTITNWSNAFTNATGDLSLYDFANTYNATIISGFFDGSTITAVPKINCSNVVSARSLICNNPNIEIIDLNLLDFYNCVDLSTAFCNNLNLREFKANNLKFPKNMSLSYAFYSLPNLENIEISNWEVYNVADMNSIFAGATKLKTIDISGWDTSKVNNFTFAFGNCYELENIIGTIDLTSCKTVDLLFSGSQKLKNVRLKNVPRTLDFSSCGGTEGITYIIENYLD